MPTQPHHVPIAIVGASAIFPGSIDATGFWHDVLAGNDLVSDIPPSHWLIEDYYDPDPSVPDMTYAKRGAFLKDIDFDALAWGVPPNILPQTDTTQLLALIAAQRVLEDATAGDLGRVDRERTSVILGVTSGQDLLGKMVSRLQHPIWRKSLREMGLPEDEVDEACRRIASHYAKWEESTFPGLLGNVVAGRIANRLDLGGTNCVTDAACASSFSAIQMAVNELTLGQSDLVISGGCDTMNDIFMYMCFSKTPALSPSGECAPFSDRADGTLLGEGLGMVALKRLDDAERDGDRIYAVLRGVGSSSDGRSKSVYAPRPAGQAKAIGRAYDIAGYGPETVELIEAHGTGTKAGDAAEFEGLKLAFSPHRDDRQWCALGTVKSQIGHTKAAAGAAGLFKAVMALHHKVLPPTIKIERPNPKLELETTPFYLNTRTRPWVRDASHPRRAGVSSFGFGGSNFHLAVEEYAGATRALRLRTLPTELVTLAADDAAALIGRIDAVLASLRPGALAWWAWSTATDAPTGRIRLAIVADDEDALRARLQTARDHLGRAPTQGLQTPNGIALTVDAAPGDVALLFPGQGSQYLEMGGEVAASFDAAMAAWDAAAAAEHPVHPVVFPIPRFDPAEAEADAALLTRTEWAQPAIGVNSLAALAMLRALGVTPAATGGHSFGEVMALHAAGALDADAAIAVARRRGELMAEAASRPGAMAAVPAPVELVREVLAALDGDAVLANHNSPTQIVISGPTDDVQRAIDAFAARGVECKRLSVATAFHSAVVADSAEPFRAFLDGVDVRAPSLPTYANSTAAPYAAEPGAVRDTLAAQIAQPVRFVEQIEAMYAAGVRTFVECGPGNVLTNLVGQILGDRPHTAIATDRRRKHGVTSLQLAAGQLFAAGLPIDASALWAGYREPVDPATVARPKMAVPINGSNYGQPYPGPNGAADNPPPNGPRPAPEPQVVYVEVPSQGAASPQPTSPAPEAAMSDPNRQGDSWVAAFAEAQRQTAEAHATYQSAMASSHQAYLRTVEASFATLSALATGQPAAYAPPAPQLTAAPVPPPSFAAYTPSVAPAPAPVAATPAPAPVATPAPVAAAPAPAPVAAAPAPAPAPVAPASAGPDLQALLMDVVADKTGYPPEMLSLEMSLEGDLGIDSIKRVEILSAMREREPSLPEVDAGEMAALSTLGEIVTYMNGGVAAGPAAPAASAAPAAGGPDLQALLMDVVADKTGYPPEMLSLEMSLEGDLGIDSIKRVEILSAMREREPSLPEVDAGEMAALSTLGEIVTYMNGEGSTVNPKLAQPDPSSSVLGLPSDMGRYALELIDTPALGFAQPGLQAEVWITGHDQIGPALVDALLARGVDARYTADVPDGATALIHLGGLGEDASPEAGRALARDTFALAHRLAPTLSRGLLVTVQDTGGDFGLSGSPRAWLGHLPGLTKTAAQEWPDAATKAIDIDTTGLDADDIADRITDELLTGGPDLEVALGATRRVPASVLRPATPGPLPVGPDDVVVVSGGARGVTAACVIQLARASRARFVLLGRTPLGNEPPGLRDAHTDADLKRAMLQLALAAGDKPTPAQLGRQVSQIQANREIRATLAAVEAAGGAARYVPVDVTDADGLARALDAVRADWGPVRLLIHGAGVLADKAIADKTQAQFDFVFDTKIRGLQALLAATEADAPGVVMFSSVAARCGNQGQADYAMANELLNKLTHQLAAQGRFAKSLGWGPWAGGMVTPALEARFKALGVPLIPLDVGARMLVDELGDATADRELVLGGEPRSEALAAEASAPALRLAVRVDDTLQPWLADHAIAGHAVVPVVLAVEWFAHAAKALKPELHVASIDQVRVLKGIRIPDLEVGAWLELRLRQIDNGVGASLAAELVTPNGPRHYSATVRMTERPVAAGRAPGIGVLEPWEGEVYDGDVLFHGERFQVIDAIHGVSAEGLEARLQGTLAKDWEGRFSTDPAALDGGLQLALLWAQRLLGGPTLPTAVASFRTFGVGPATGPLTACLRAGSNTGSRATVDVVLATEDGRVYAALDGVETHLRPGARA